MGVSTDAVLFYGYCWKDEERLPGEASRLWSKDEPVLTGRHCSDTYSIPYVYAAGSRVLAWRGEPKNVTIETLNVDPEWDRSLLSFCERFEIQPPQDNPQWWLVSWWG